MIISIDMKMSLVFFVGNLSTSLFLMSLCLRYHYGEWHLCVYAFFFFFYK